jgi:S-adenosylhomocysteine hydrolase
MNSKDALVKVIREVPITGKTYEEYVEAVAEKILSQKLMVIPNGADSVTWIREGEKDNGN